MSYWVWFLAGGLFFFVGVVGTLVTLFSNDRSAVSVGLFQLVLGGVFVLPPIIASLTTELVITNRRVIAKFGLIRRNTIELNLSKIESIRVEQSILGRLLNYGTVFLIGTGGSKEPIPRISHPLEFRRRYDEILSQA